MTKQTVAKVELERFLKVAVLCQEKDASNVYMPCCYVDKVWHELLTDTVEYTRIVSHVFSGEIDHISIKGSGIVEWVPLYEEKFGKLHSIWFTDENEIVNEKSYGEYLETGVMRASWDCTPYIRPKKSGPVKSTVQQASL